MYCTEIEKLEHVQSNKASDLERAVLTNSKSSDIIGYEGSGDISGRSAKDTPFRSKISWPRQRSCPIFHPMGSSCEI